MGLPPRFSEGDPGSTLFGVPDEFEREDSMLGDLSELHSAPKPASPPSQFRFAPPPLPPRAKAAPPPQKKEEEEVLHEELDLEFGSETALELDVPDLQEDSGALDLPVPTAAPARNLQLPRPPEAIDLPAPARSAAAHRLPPPPPSAALESFPGPSGAPPSRPQTPPPPRSVTPLPDTAHDLDLPFPARSGESLDLPMPLELDLPQPKGSPRSSSHLAPPRDEDLLQPAFGNGNLLEPSRAEVEPREQRLQPAGQWLAPASQDVQPKDQFLTPAEQNLQPVGAGTSAGMRGSQAGSRSARETAASGPLHAGSIPGAAPARSGQRTLLLAGLAALALVGGGAGVFYAGIFDDEPTAPRGAPELGGGAAAPARDGVTERSEAVLALFRRDDAAAYRTALQETAQARDAVGQAEAALLLHLRYGPDGVLLGQARALLGTVGEHGEPFVTRVRALDALAREDWAAAEAALVGDDPRTHLYRGWAKLGQAQAESALQSAEAVLAKHADDLAAIHLRHAAELRLDPREAFPRLRQSVADHPTHAGLRVLAAEAALAQGLLREAETLAAEFVADEAAPAGYKARIHALRGHIAAAKGDSAIATEHFDRALELDPRNPEIGVAKVRLLIEAGLLLDANQAVKDLLEHHPKALEPALLAVELDLASGRGDEALQALDVLAQAHPDHALLALLEGKVHAMRLQLEAGDAAFAKALERDPNLTEAVIAKARMYAHARQHDAAITQLQARLDADPTPAAQLELLLAKAELLVAAQQPEAALAALDAALALDPQNNRAQTQRGILRHAQNDLAGARQDLAAVFERTGGFRGMAAPFGRMLSREGDIERLEELVGDQVDDPRTEPELKIVGVRLRLLQGNSEAAKRLAQEVLAKEPSHWEAHMLLADAYRQSRDYAEALERIQMAQPPGPNAELLLLKGKILEFNGRYAEARPEYQRALAVDPTLSEARFLYGRSLAYAGASKAAITELSQVIRETGTKYPAAYAAMGRAQKELGNYAQAVASLAKATELDPTQYEAWYHKGTVHAFKNQHREAAEALRQAVAEEASSNEWYSDAWMRLGRALFHLGERSEAKNALEQYLAVAPPHHAGRGEAQRLLRELGA